MGGIGGCVINNPETMGKTLRSILIKQSHLGFDGTGIAIIKNSKINIIKSPKRAKEFVQIDHLEKLSSNIGICDVRHATHGRPHLDNTQPLDDCNGEIAVAMEGVIWNYSIIRDRLSEKGHIFKSRTDAEIISHLLEDYIPKNGLLDGIRKTYFELDGSFSFAVIHSKYPDKIAIVNKDSNVYIGRNENGIYFATEIDAIRDLVLEFLKLNFDKLALITQDSVEIIDLKKGIPESFEWQPIAEAPKGNVPGGWPHFMLREIHESTLWLKRAIMTPQKVYLDLAASILNDSKKIFIIGCGTSYHAGMISSYIFRELAGLSPTIIDAAEFTYYSLKEVKTGTTVIAISQSGASTDVLRAVSKAKLHGAIIIGVTNSLGTPLMFASNVYLPIGIGPERAVPATKSFLGQIIALYQLIIATGLQNNFLNEKEAKEIFSHLYKLPRIVEETIAMTQDKAREISEQLYKRNSLYVVSRGLNYPIALEGALKFKETAYLHAEGVEAGELRHGPKALVYNNFPVILIMPKIPDAVEDSYKLISEIKQMGGNPIIITNKGDKTSRKLSKNVIYVPNVPRIFTPIVNAIPLQLLAYYTGIKRGSPIDVPRGLSKAVIL
ncbi:MAG: glutamine--fructose-6-phosphate transaminase (isomerizing) [Candidatus Njordarchaeia archaeon]|nr:glutamine--fructose-6-phosphate transaminase (isomerizing) [Candidatus Korarchaeota archaeon]